MWLIPFIVLAIVAGLGRTFWGEPDGAPAAVGLLMLIGAGALIIGALAGWVGPDRRKK